MYKMETGITNDISEFGTTAANITLEMNKVAERPTLQGALVSQGALTNQYLNQWSIMGDNNFMACGNTIESLPPGLYNIHLTERGIKYSKKTINIDTLIKFEDSVVEKVIAEIELFWTLKEKFYQYGYLHRRGYLLYGPQGSGKSMTVQQIIQGIILRKGIAFLCSDGVSPHIVNAALGEFRIIEPTRHVVCIFEDIDAYIKEYGENEILSVLDGENQINDVLNIATTNYPERLDKRIIARPRRFDRIIKVGMPNKLMREKYLREKLKLNVSNINEWVEDTDGFSFAALAELVIGVECLGNTFDTTIKVLKELMKNKQTSDDFNGPREFGFTEKRT